MFYLLLIAGLAVLIIGGEFLVKGGVGFSNILKLSPLVIGMTVVAFGTSAPELIVSLNSAVMGNPGIAIGNVVGSNIVNITLILGLTVMIFPIVIDRQVKVLDLPMMILATLLFTYFSLDGEISILDGTMLFSILLVYLIYVIRNSRKKTKKALAECDDVLEIQLPAWKSGMFLLAGFVGLYFGSEWFIEGAVGIANQALEGHPDKDVIIGVTVVAFGTSAPELVASCVAAYRKQQDMALGNLVGSNIFNILAVIGITGIVKPIEVSQSTIINDYSWMGIAAGILTLSIYIGHKIGRLKGVVLFATYIAYVGLIIYHLKTT